MSVSARAVAVQGLGFPSRLLAVQGLGPAPIRFISGAAGIPERLRRVRRRRREDEVLALIL